MTYLKKIIVAALMGGIFIVPSVYSASFPKIQNPLQIKKPTSCVQEGEPAKKPSARPAAIGFVSGFPAGAIIGSIYGSPIIGGVIGGGVGTLIGYTYIDVHPLDLRNHGILVVHVRNKTIIIIPSDKLFESASSRFKITAYPIMQDVADYLERFPRENIHISGNTDPIAASTAKDRIRLSLQQAQKITHYFWEHGIHHGQTCREITYSGDGDHYPIATNEKISGITLNRRIQITAFPA